VFDNGRDECRCQKEGCEKADSNDREPCHLSWLSVWMCSLGLSVVVVVVVVIVVLCMTFCNLCS
jgi:hypothetical protein